MLKITILTLFPNIINGWLNESIIKNAVKNNKCEIEVINFRDFSKEKTKKVDDYQYGGSAGMVLMLQPIVDALSSIKTKDSYSILLSPSGYKYNQTTAKELSTKKHIVLIAGHYEGFDERIMNYVDTKISIGDYVLTNGEIASITIADSIIRLIDGTINSESLKSESFDSYLLDFPVYTKPREFSGHKVPEVLLSGNHKEIEKYRLEQQIKLTKKYRKDLYDLYKKTK